MPQKITGFYIFSTSNINLRSKGRTFRYKLSLPIFDKDLRVAIENKIEKVTKV